jgi:hypothetical protein
MKIVAIILTCTLLGVMGWLVLDARSEARGARNQMEMLRRERGGDADPAQTTGVIPQDAVAGKEQQLLELMARNQGAGNDIPPPLCRPSLPARAVYPVPTDVARGSAGSVPGAMTLPPGMDPSNIAPPPMSPRQRMISAAPVLAKVTEYQKEFGFVVINAGTKRKLEKDMTFAIRRGSAIIGRIKVTEVSDEGSVADLPASSVPSGVSIEVGDEVIQDMPPEA